MRLWLAYVRRTPLLLFLLAYTVTDRRPVPLGRLDVAAHHFGDLR